MKYHEVPPHPIGVGAWYFPMVLEHMVLEHMGIEISEL
jgi:hypothetical protein